MADRDHGPISLVTEAYIPVPDDRISIADEIIADLRTGKLTGFVLVAVGPETAGAICGFSGGRMDRMTLLGNLAMARRQLEDQEMGLR